ncbi:MAG: binding-protein-dependent transport system inner rane component, partial [Clostridia bacterium]|nr:binding-protein-dependent transport system inner rane component [Clostridia bacterium]
MINYIVKRAFISLITIWVLITVTFFLVRLVPGDPFLSDKITPEIKANMMKYYGLDQPLYKQYVKYLGNLAKGDLGNSLRYRARSINDVIADHFPISANLGLRALVFATVVGVLLGIIAALNHNKGWDRFSIFIAVIGISVPNFIIAGFIQWLFGVELGWLPVAAWKGEAYTIMPAFALGLGTLALLARYMRTSMLDVVGQDYIKTAKAKGLSPIQVTIKHQIRNALLPVVTILGPVAAALLTGGFVVETVFAIPGLGQHYVRSMQNLDYPMIMGTTIFYGAFLVVMNFIVDIVYGLIDPRIR